MHFLKAITEMLAAHFHATFRRILKPSPSFERWVGFDQGWASTRLSIEEVLRELRNAINHNLNTVIDFYFGYFLQYKVVQRMYRRSAYACDLLDAPYFRAEVSIDPNGTTGLSQHETLLRLSRIRNAFVYYACPMIFDQEVLWQEANLNMLQIVDVVGAPSYQDPNERHFIEFQDEHDNNPIWCTDPQSGKAVSAKEWPYSHPHTNGFSRMTAQDILRLITDTREVTSSNLSFESKKKVLSCFNLLSFKVEQE